MTDHSDPVIHPICDSPFRQGPEFPPKAAPGDLFLLTPLGDARQEVFVWLRGKWIPVQPTPLDDATLVRFAKQAGLCIPHCWDIDLMMDSGSAQDDQRWVDEAADAKERRRRKESVDAMHTRAQEALQKLRRFAELVQAAQS